MANKRTITAEFVRQLLEYDSKTGTLIWKTRTAAMFKDGYRSADAECRRWNAIYAGTPAGTLRKGYLRIRIGCYRPNAHCVIWLILHGEWPKDQIDHRDGSRAENKEENLREATAGQNAQNRKKRKNNRSGHTGVWSHKSKWRAELCVDGRRIYLGIFDDKEKARAVYLVAKSKYHVFQPRPRENA